MEKERKREGGRKRESITEPPLLACRALMNANHDPEAARSTCCFPVQIAYNFYCHGRNSSLMEARLILVLVLRPGCVPCVLLPSPRSSHTTVPLPTRFLTPFPSPFCRASPIPSVQFRFLISFLYSINDSEHAGRVFEKHDRVSILYNVCAMF